MLNKPTESGFTLEVCESAANHISGLAEQARQGNLGSGGWLSRDTYYLKATIYQLLLPAAVYRLMNRRLTVVDLRLDTTIHAQYLLARTAYLAFTHDQLIARMLGQEYAPYVPGWREKRKEQPQIYRRQGFTLGRLDNAVLALVEHNDENPRIVPFGKFEGELEKVAEDDVNSDLGTARDMFLEFHPKTRPILWQILFTQAILYRCIGQLSEDRRPSLGEILGAVGSPPDAETARLDWQGGSEGQQGLGASLRVASHYMETQVGAPLVRVLSPKYSGRSEPSDGLDR